jgi:hypothetical protein
MAHSDLCSFQVLYEWTSPYIEFTSRRLQNRTFGPLTLETSLAADGVSITTLSPVVPAATQKLIAAEQVELKTLPWSERVFCGRAGAPLRASNGSVMVAAGGCLTQAQYETMDWFVSNTQDLGLYLAPLQYTFEYVGQPQFVAMIAIATFVVALELVVGQL